MTTRVLVSVSCAIVITGAVIAFAFLPRPTRGNIVLGDLGTSSTTSLVYSYGQKKGIFAEFGLNVTRVSAKDPYTNLLNLLTGKIDITAPSPSLIANAYNEGEDIRIVMAFASAKDLVLVTDPSIEEASDLRGRRIGVIGRASDSYNILKWYMDAKSIDIENECEVIEIPNPANLVVAFLTGEVDAATLWGGYSGQAIDGGGMILFTYSDALLETTGHPHYHNVFAVREDAAVDPKTLERFLDAVKETISRIRADPDDAARIWAEFAGLPVDKVRGCLDRVDLVGEMDDQIQADIAAFFRKAALEGYIEETPGEDIFRR